MNSESINTLHVQMAGIRNKEDALMCVEAGVDIIGLLVGQKHESDDFISKEQAKEIVDALPLNIKTTLITHLENAKSIIDIAKFLDVDYIQFHSNIKESEVAKVKSALPTKKFIRLIHISSNGKILTNVQSIKYADFYFTDSINAETNQVGGTGLTHNLEADKRIIKALNKPVYIAGGLTPENVAEAVATCSPYAVDVNTGCRASGGGRDKEKVITFVNNARK